MKPAIVLCEVGLRDRLQNEPTILNLQQKMALVERIVQSGFKVIELGSFMHPKAVPQMADTDELFRQISHYDGVEFRALVANKKGVERAIACGCKKVKLNVSASKAHNLANLNRTPQESVSAFREMVELASGHGLMTSGSISMPFGSPWEHNIPIEDVEQIIEAYLNVSIREISLSDASGMATPEQVESIASHLQTLFPMVKFILHFHNTRGLAIANIMAGLKAGVTWFDTSFAGLGGCPFVPGAAGNVASEDVIHLFDEMGYTTGINLDAALTTAREVVQLVGHPTDSYILKAGKSKDLILELPRQTNHE